VHYDTKTGDYSGKTISHELINVLWLIGAFILLIACVNFINLSTAQSVYRAKEVGVRKVLGSNKWQLKMQFITETFLIVFTSVVLALIITWIALPSLNKILELPLSVSIFNDASIVLFLVIIALVVTVLAGFYPSVILSGFNPIDALKSKLSAKSTKGISLRKGLVVFQFIIAQALIIGTLIILKQMNYFSSQPLGFEKDAIVNIPFPADSVGLSKLDYLKKQLSGVSGIQNVSFSSNTPVEDDNDNWTTFKFNHAIKETDFYAINKWTDNEYVPTYKLPLIAGRNLVASDTAREFLVNEMLIKNLGITNPRDALNKEINLWDGRIKGAIVGVLKDFTARSFRRDLAPVIITTLKQGYSEAGIKLATTDVTSALHSIEKIWNQAFPDFVFEYKFLDDKVESFYKQENQLAQLYKIFASIAIFLSCLGLYGLASFMAVQRIKEVGIRKVLGATAGNIVYLFSKEFIMLISIAFGIAAPLAWYFMHQWLQNYPFRIEMSWWVFLIGGLASIFIALATVSFQAIKAAVSNPVKSLRTE
jgi:ABC-type antimicrobial peptide transport system permease subunit